MPRKSASKASASAQSLSSGASPASATTGPHGRSSSFSKTSSKFTSFFSPSRAVRSVSPTLAATALPTLPVPSIRVSPPGAEYEQQQRPATAPDYPRNWQEEAKRNAQFGRIGDLSHRHVSRHPRGTVVPQPVMDEPPYFYLITTYISYLIFIIFGHVRDFFGKRFKQHEYAHLREQDVKPISLSISI
jgi:serine palmitoyltransferase